MNEKSMELLARVLEGEATPEEVRRLVRMLPKDEGLRREAAEIAALHGCLGVAMEDEVARERRTRQVMDAVRETDGEAFVARVRRRLETRRWVVRVTAAAALVALSVFGIWRFGTHASSKPDAVMATFVRGENLDWGNRAPLAEGARLEANGRLDFRTGLAELDMEGRGRMVVEGPAVLEFPEAGRAVLRRGRVLMRVTPAGRGFRVETPKGTVIDLGTEFGVAVGEDGEGETHVLDGRVDAVNDDGSRVMLYRDDALRFGPSGGERIAAEGGAFYTRMPPLHQEEPKCIHWSFDENKGLLARASRMGLGDRNSDMVFHAMDAGRAPEWVDGVFGSALCLDGKGAYAESGFRGIGGGNPRTVCFWVKVPENFSPRQGFGIVSWGSLHSNRPGTAWQISVNPLADDGPVGHLRIGLHMDQVIGSTDLRDNRWHHIAVVLYGGSRPDVGTHVMLYVDGELEHISRRALREVHTDIDTAGHGVWVGRNVSYIRSDPRHAHGGFFRGEIDELSIFDAALGRNEIQRLMKKNR